MGRQQRFVVDLRRQQLAVRLVHLAWFTRWRAPRRSVAWAEPASPAEEESREHRELRYRGERGVLCAARAARHEGQVGVPYGRVAAGLGGGGAQLLAGAQAEDDVGVLRRASLLSFAARGARSGGTRRKGAVVVVVAQRGRRAGGLTSSTCRRPLADTTVTSSCPTGILALAAAPSQCECGRGSARGSQGRRRIWASVPRPLPTRLCARVPLLGRGRGRWLPTPWAALAAGRGGGDGRLRRRRRLRQRVVP